MKLLILDDDVQIREGIQLGIDWAGLGISDVKSCGDGISGLEMVESFRPNIVLADVRMPGMDGLEFLSIVKQKHPEIKVIMVSGYNDFEYLKKALQYGAEDYELKPIKVRSLINVIRRTKDTIVKENNTRENYQLYRAAYDEQFLKEVLGGTVTDQNAVAEFLSRKMRQFSEKSLLCALISINPRPGEIAICPEDAASIQQALTHKPEDYLLFTLEDGQILMLAPTPPSKLVSLNILHRMKSFLSEQLISLQKDHCSFCVGITMDYPIHMLHKAYTRANQLLTRCYIMGRGSICTDVEQTVSDSEKNNESLSSEMIQPVVNAFADLNIEQLKQEFDHFGRNMISQADKLEIGALRNYIWSSFEKINRHLLSENRTDALFDLSQTKDELNRFIFFEDIFAYWNEKLLQTLTLEIGRKAGHYNPRMQKVIDHIHRHYAEDITANTMAELTQTTPNYFSATFKSEVGVSFKKYLNDLRLKAAVKLLLTTALRVSEIAEQTGFNNYVYFSQSFKKAMGCSPSEYRNKVTAQ